MVKRSQDIPLHNKFKSIFQKNGNKWMTYQEILGEAGKDTTYTHSQYQEFYHSELFERKKQNNAHTCVYRLRKGKQHKTIKNNVCAEFDMGAAEDKDYVCEIDSDTKSTKTYETRNKKEITKKPPKMNHAKKKEYKQMVLWEMKFVCVTNMNNWMKRKEITKELNLDVPEKFITRQLRKKGVFEHQEGLYRLVKAEYKQAKKRFKKPSEMVVDFNVTEEIPTETVKQREERKTLPEFTIIYPISDDE